MGKSGNVDCVLVLGRLLTAARPEFGQRTATRNVRGQFVPVIGAVDQAQTVTGIRQEEADVGGAALKTEPHGDQAVCHGCDVECDPVGANGQQDGGMVSAHHACQIQRNAIAGDGFCQLLPSDVSPCPPLPNSE